MSKGFNMGGMNRNQMMAQARKMQEQLLAAQQKAAATEVSPPPWTRRTWRCCRT